MLHHMKKKATKLNVRVLSDLFFFLPTHRKMKKNLAIPEPYWKRSVTMNSNQVRRYSYTDSTVTERILRAWGNTNEFRILLYNEARLKNL